MCLHMLTSSVCFTDIARRNHTRRIGRSFRPCDSLVYCRSAPHFTTQEHTQQCRTCAVGLAAIKRPKTRETPFRPAEHNTPRARGFPWYTGRAPRKLGWWGCKRTRGEQALTMSAFSFPQFTQMHSRIFFTLTMKPARGIGESHMCEIR